MDKGGGGKAVLHFAEKGSYGHYLFFAFHASCMDNKSHLQKLFTIEQNCFKFTFTNTFVTSSLVAIHVITMLSSHAIAVTS